MSKNILQLVLAFVLGVIAIIVVVGSWSFLFGSTSDSSEYLVQLVYAATYLFFGVIAGLFWRNKSIYGGLWLALPLVLVGMVSMWLLVLGRNS